MLLDIILLQAQPAAPTGEEAPGGGGLQFLLMVGAIIVVFYFFMIRPQQKRQKQEASFREGLKKGDKVTTIGGIHGRIVSVDEATALVEVDNGVKLKMDKGALKGVVEDAGGQKK